MRVTILVMVVVALAQSAGARADGSPSWARRAMRIVARIHVPERDDILDHGNRIPTRDGSGFFVGSVDQVAYLVTAGHVIWPQRELPKSEIVKLDIEMQLPDCHALVPALADRAQLSPRDELDVAIVTLKLTDMPNGVGNHCQDVITHLPRNIMDPDAGSLEENAHAWLIGPGTRSEAIDARPIIFEKYAKNALQFREPAFTEGDSGSPIFSERGLILGMAIKKEGGVATTFIQILTKLDKDWVKPTNLAGWPSKLWFSDRYKDRPLSIDGAPSVALQRPHPAPRGQVGLKLWVDGTQQVTGTVDIEGTDMNCDVAVSRWLAVHRRAAVYTTLGLVAATGVAFALARTSQNSFNQSPSRSSYDHVGLFNTIAIGTGSAALASLGATVFGYFSSDTTGIICREGQR